MIRRRMIVLMAAAAMLAPGSATAQSARFNEALKAYEKQDYTTALYYWKQLADNNDGLSQYNLGILYLYGRGVERNVAEAYKWFLLARDNHVEVAADAINRIEATIQPKDLNEGLRLREEWHRAHGF